MTEIENLDREGEEKANKRNGSKGPGPDPRREHQTRTRSVWSRGLCSPAPGRAVMAPGTPAAGALPVARPDAHIGGLVGPQRHGVPSASSGGFRTSRHLLHRPRHPSPSHGAEVTRSWGRRPGRRRDLARPTERQESVKEARSLSAKTASLSQSLARQGWGRVKGGGPQ